MNCWGRNTFGRPDSLQGDALGNVLRGLKPMGYSVFALRAMPTCKLHVITVSDEPKFDRLSTSSEKRLQHKNVKSYPI